jgi:PBP1b-binding outer membrane lipoprotein LpoB
MKKAPYLIILGLLLASLLLAGCIKAPKTSVSEQSDTIDEELSNISTGDLPEPQDLDLPDISGIQIS